MKSWQEFVEAFGSNVPNNDNSVMLNNADVVLQQEEGLLIINGYLNGQKKNVVLKLGPYQVSHFYNGVVPENPYGKSNMINRRRV